MVFIHNHFYHADVVGRNGGAETQKNSKKQKKGVERKVPVEMLRSYIGKKVTVVCSGAGMGFEGVIVKVEDNWLMLEGKKHIQIVTCDAVQYINLQKEA